MLLKYLNKMNVFHWCILMVGLFALFSVGKVVAIVGVGLTLLVIVVKYWGKLNKLLRGD